MNHFIRLAFVFALFLLVGCGGGDPHSECTEFGPSGNCISYDPGDRNDPSEPGKR